MPPSSPAAGSGTGHDGPAGHARRPACTVMTPSPATLTMPAGGPVVASISACSGVVLVDELQPGVEAERRPG